MRSSSRLFALFLATAAGCAGTEISEAPPSATIRVITTSSGVDTDPDGYLVRLGSQAFPVEATDTLFLAVPIGDHRLALEGLSANCHPAGPATQDVRADAGTIAEVAFQVACGATYGVLEVAITTTGLDADLDGYLLTVGGWTPLRIQTSGTWYFPVPSDSVTRVALQDLAANCTASGDNPRDVRVALGGAVRDTVRLAYAVACATLGGSARVQVVTTGDDPDADGYSVGVNCVEDLDDPLPACAQVRPVSSNGAVTITRLWEGTHTLELLGVAPNCSVTGSSVRSVQVGLGDTPEVQFAVTCRPLGMLQVTTSTTGVNLDASGYQMLVNSDLLSVPVNGTVGVRMPAGTYRVRLDDVSFNCDPSDTTQRTVVVPEGGSVAVSFAVSCRSADELAFSAPAVPNGPTEIFRVRSNDGVPIQLTFNTGSYAPAWSPDGSRIVFVRGGNIFVMNADGSGQTQLTNHPADDGEPAWAPDGTQIVFQSRRDGLDQIYVMNADGTGQRRLVTSASQDMSPAWSPDGTRIAFVRNGYIHVMNSGGSGAVELPTPPGFLHGSPAWSPDGTRLALVGWVCWDIGDCYGNLLIINADGSGLAWLGPLGADPAWSRDGQWVAYSGEGIEATRTNGNELRRIRTGRPGAEHPDWRP